MRRPISRTENSVVDRNMTWHKDASPEQMFCVSSGSQETVRGIADSRRTGFIVYDGAECRFGLTYEQNSDKIGYHKQPASARRGNSELSRESQVTQ